MWALGGQAMQVVVGVEMGGEADYCCWGHGTTRVTDDQHLSHKGQLSVSHAAARNSSVQHPASACIALGCSACCQLLAEPSSAAWHSSARWVVAAGRIRASRLLLRTALAIDPSEPPPLPLVCGAAADVQSSLARPPAVS